ncbi:MAG: winged helix-turn-helix domain-containing protein [Planctomycetota bacterium]|nr:winged helix-turn-helix domain-containing protein [Planctomycetota bacterium]MDA1137077.1 winged helix-turn-helix domain-containing protein [Planctomycetota bacterium]
MTNTMTDTMTDSVASIGGDAGQIWIYLYANGSASPTQLVRALKTTAANVHRAIGWLAREGKVDIVRQRGIERVVLIEEV